MRTIAYHTLGCKVNQYDTQAMEELLSAAGYQTVPFSSPADIYLINTCTVTGTGDRKSLQLARRLKRKSPDCILILCGCLAQIKGQELLSCGADLIIGTQFRNQIAVLLNKVLLERKPYCAVEPFSEDTPFEPLYVTKHLEHTRAVMKIQEGCRNHCTYCIIPAVRGPIRSRSPEDIRSEADHLAASGFKEIVLTGIHLSSYGKDLESSVSLLDVIGILEKTDGIKRIRLGSLEPGIATPAFTEALRGCQKLCPQFHLALQSGSDSVLRRMRRQYNASAYLKAVERLRAVFPSASFTTDILTGFPGETDEEFCETKEMIRKVGFSRIHVFPYSPRPGTPAAGMPGQISEEEKQRRARELIALGNTVSACYRKQWIGKTVSVLIEEQVDGCWEGYSPEYLRIRLSPDAACIPGEIANILIQDISPRTLGGVII